MHVSLHVMCVHCSWRPEEGFESRTGVIDGCEALGGTWEYESLSSGRASKVLLSLDSSYVFEIAGTDRWLVSYRLQNPGVWLWALGSPSSSTPKGWGYSLQSVPNLSTQFCLFLCLIILDFRCIGVLLTHMSVKGFQVPWNWNSWHVDAGNLLGSSGGRAVGANCWTISPAPNSLFHGYTYLEACILLNHRSQRS